MPKSVGTRYSTPSPKQAAREQDYSQNLPREGGRVRGGSSTDNTTHIYNYMNIDNIAGERGKQNAGNMTSRGKKVQASLDS